MRLQAHAAILESIVPQLEAEGFEVYTRPSPSLLPPFLQTDAPDAIALRGDRKLAVEVVHKGASSERRLDRLRVALVDHRDWELRVYWISPSSAPEAIELSHAATSSVPSPPSTSSSPRTC